MDLICSVSPWKVTTKNVTSATGWLLWNCEGQWSLWSMFLNVFHVDTLKIASVPDWMFTAPPQHLIIWLKGGWRVMMVVVEESEGLVDWALQNHSCHIARKLSNSKFRGSMFNCVYDFCILGTRIMPNLKHWMKSRKLINYFTQLRLRVLMRRLFIVSMLWVVLCLEI